MVEVTSSNLVVPTTSPGHTGSGSDDRQSDRVLWQGLSGTAGS